VRIPLDLLVGPTAWVVAKAQVILRRFGDDLEDFLDDLGPFLWIQRLDMPLRANLFGFSDSGKFDQFSFDPLENLDRTKTSTIAG